jgi:hypothetical protein
VCLSDLRLGKGGRRVCICAKRSDKRTRAGEEKRMYRVRKKVETLRFAGKGKGEEKREGWEQGAVYEAGTGVAEGTTMRRDGAFTYC